MRTVQIYNASKNSILLDKALFADTFFARLKGLLGRKELQPGEGMVIYPCNAIHTLGMSIHIDVVFVDRENRVCSIISQMPPNRLGKRVKKARFVIEGPAGGLSGVDVGDTIGILG